MLLPGAKQAFVPLSPSLSDEDKQVVENVVKIGEALLRVLSFRVRQGFRQASTISYLQAQHFSR